MTMKKSVVSAVVLVALLLIDVGPLAQAACSAAELSPCVPAITSGSPPSTACCSKLKQQKPCLCGYFKDPTLKEYVNSPNTRKVLSSCGVPYPKC